MDKSIKKSSVKKLPVKKSSVKKAPIKKHEEGNVSAFCFPCRKKVYIDHNLKLVKRKTPNGQLVTILCGNCLERECNGKKVCKIIANEKA